MIQFLLAKLNISNVKRDSFKMNFIRNLIIAMVLVISFAEFINGDESDEANESVANVAVKPKMKEFTNAKKSTAEDVEKDLQEIKQHSQASSGIGGYILQSMKLLSWPLKFVWNNVGTTNTNILTSSKTSENKK